MPILYLKHADIDLEQWNAVVALSPQRQVYAMSWYLDVVSPNWEGMVEADAAGIYKAVMPVPWRRKLGMRYVQQPLFCQQLGIYTLEQSIPKATYQAFTEEIYKRFRYVVDYNFNTENQLPPLPLPEVQVEHTLTLYLNLCISYEQLYEGYSRDRKMNLKRAQKASLQIGESDDIEPIIRFFKEETAARIYGGVAEGAYEMLRQLYQVLREKCVGRLYYTTDKQGRKNSGCLFIVWGGRIVYIFNAAPQHGRKQNGRTLLIDHMIREHAGQEVLFDFESPDEREPDILHFYKSFSPEAKPIPVLKYNRLPKGVKLMREARMRLVRKLRG
ncbi:GNAT family N-acetyltransferase [Pontibacter pamirensis]|uniref:GNAT family N-acetyltransferase n=1 Tax=Pontibacter pamirensis TaxID=2562824 RepID=UPI0013896367|nr:GNAT family N-acetyltransferase [Pontibacter pamirensis]